MERLIRMGMLLDLYASLLTTRQREILDAYANENLSLTELSERLGISRQGVADALGKGERQLERHEADMGLLAKRLRCDEALAKMQAAIDRFGNGAQKDALTAAFQALNDTMEDEDGI